MEKDTYFGAWVVGKLRYNYDLVDGNLVLYMPLLLYDIFAIRLQEVIARELKALKEVLKKRKYTLGKKHPDTI